jgi:hypothetical protein
MHDARTEHRYTPFFCEENVWWLAHERRHASSGQVTGWVCLFTNDTASIAVMNQHAAPATTLMAWDYHVVLAVPQDGVMQVFDLDSRLPFPSPWSAYFRGTFPNQPALPPRWRTRLRQVPVGAYLDRFCSDRHHMQGKLPATAFPDYPPLCPQDRSIAIVLQDYLDLDRGLDDGSRVGSVDQAMEGPLCAPSTG